MASILDFIWPTSSAASPTWPVATPSCSICWYTSSKVVAAGSESTGMSSCPRLAVRPAVSSATITRSGCLAAIASTFGSSAERSRDRRVGRVVRVAVDRGHLRAGADGVEHLGRRRRQRDDRPRLLVQRHAAVGRGDGDREGAAGGRRRRRGGRRGPPRSRRVRWRQPGWCRPHRCRSCQRCRRPPGERPSSRPARR